MRAAQALRHMRGAAVRAVQALRHMRGAAVRALRHVPVADGSSVCAAISHSLRGCGGCGGTRSFHSLQSEKKNLSVVPTDVQSTQLALVSVALVPS